MTPVRKPLSATEREDLQHAANHRSGWDYPLFVGGCAAALVLGIEALVASALGIEDWLHSWVAYAPALVVAVPVIVRTQREQRRMDAPARERAARMLAAGAVDEEVVQVRDAIEVEETEDEGPHYYLQLADGRVLFVSGQYLLDFAHDPDEEDVFPRRSLTLRRSPATGELLGVKPRGPYLAPTTTRPKFSDFEQEARLVPANGDVLLLPFDSLRTPAG